MDHAQNGYDAVWKCKFGTFPFENKAEGKPPSGKSLKD